MVEEVKELCNYVQMTVFAKVNSLDHTQVHVCHFLGVYGIAAETQRPRREWKSVAEIRIEAYQWIDRTARSHDNDRCQSNFPRNGQIPKPIKGKSLLLMLA